MSEIRYLRSSSSKSKKKHSLNECDSRCIRKELSVYRQKSCKIQEDCLILRNQNPLNVPLICGWERRKGEGFIYYLTPCRIRCKDFQQILSFLTRTKSSLSIDQFHFGFYINVNRPQKSINALSSVTDVTDGLENIDVPLVDELNENATLPSLKYSSDRIFSHKIKLDDEFSSCCECNDNCVDTSKCNCVQLTINEAKLIKASQKLLKRTKGYHFKRLLTLHPSGIFECNKRCHCNAKCPNRVVQNGIKLRLQVFKTENKGWGLRCLDDIPKGTFICTYSGEIHSEDSMEKIATKHGDQYVAELDYIHGIESCIGILEEYGEKEDYESDVEAVLESDSNSSSLSTRSFSSEYSSSTFTEKESDTEKNSEENGRKRHVENEFGEGCSKKMKRNTSTRDESEYVPLSKYLRNQKYLIDAKRNGNIGRFLNHSCDPNCKLQSTFIDNHDPRLPVLAYFAIKKITANTELSCNYYYQHLPDTKKQPCQCGAKSCDKTIRF